MGCSMSGGGCPTSSLLTSMRNSFRRGVVEAIEFQALDFAVSRNPHSCGHRPRFRSVGVSATRHLIGEPADGFSAGSQPLHQLALQLLRKLLP
jgi:hypothetical protein